MAQIAGFSFVLAVIVYLLVNGVKALFAPREE